jgi:transposase
LPNKTETAQDVAGASAIEPNIKYRFCSVGQSCAYSLDLRQKVVAAVERGDSTIEEVAATFGVGLTFVKKMLRQQRETGDLSPRPHGGGPTPRLSTKHLKLLRSEVARRPDKTVPALRDHLEDRTGVCVSTPTVSRALSRLGLSCKKNIGGE